MPLPHPLTRKDEGGARLYIISLRLLAGKEILHLLVDIISRKAEFLVKHLVRSTEAEALHAEDTAVRAYADKSLKGYRQSCRHTKYLATRREHALLVFLRLTAEESLRRSTYHTATNAGLVQQVLSSLQRADLRATCKQDDIERLIALCNHISTLTDLLIVIALRQLGNILTGAY